MGGRSMHPLTIGWALLFLVSLIIELATPQLLTIWFLFGSATALIADILGFSGEVQIVAFFIVSAITAAISVPYLTKAKASKSDETTFKQIIGEKAKVVEDLQNITGEGRVVVKGVYWAAEEIDKINVKEGQIVEIVDVKGTKLIVRKLKEPKETLEVKEI